MSIASSPAFLAPAVLPRRRARSTTRRTAPFTAPTAAAHRVRAPRQQPSPPQTAVGNGAPQRVKAPPAAPLPYFAYFSNMNPNTLGPRARLRARRVRPLSSMPARLPYYSLSFNVPAFPPEPVMANLRADRLNQSGVHGVLHWISAQEFKSIVRSESLPPPFSSLSYVRHVTCVLPDGTQIKARTILFRPPPFSQLFTPVLRPSRRYVQTAIYGAEFHGVDDAYVQNVLRNIEIDYGPLGGFGLSAVQRPHLLDRPNPNERFGRAVDEVYSPYSHIPQQVEPAISRLQHTEQKLHAHLVRLSGKPRAAYRKKLYYVPGIDGSGKGILGQLNALEEDGVYDVSGVVIPADNRQTVPELVSDILTLIRDDAGSDPVCLFGESMGGMLSLVCASRNQEARANKLHSLKLELVVMLNPATSYSRSATRTLWETLLSIGLSDEVYKGLLPFALLPFLIDIDSVGSNFAPELVPRLQKMLSALNAVADILPPHTVRWRLDMLNSFYLTQEQYEALSSSESGTKMAVIASVNDNLLPSFSEVNRLERLIPGLYTMVLPFGGHAAATDPRFDLAAFIRPLTMRKRLAPCSPPKASEKLLKRREAFRKRYGLRAPQQRDRFSRQEMRMVLDYVEESTREFSPVFIGEENLPPYDPKRPVLFVSNHTLLGWLDTAHPVKRILQSRGVLIRALAHPHLFRAGSMSFPMMPSVDTESLKKFGVTEISPNSLVENLSLGKWSLMFPGGAPEALKDPRGTKYELFWPQEPEFVRSCALFGAQIVPLSSVGTEDSYTPFLSASELKAVIDTGSRMIGRPMDWGFAADSVRRWRGDNGESKPMIPPLPIPTEADRTYYRFGKAIDVPEECLTDRHVERMVYEQARGAVKEGIEILLKRRVRDEYRSRAKRRLFGQQFGEQTEPPAGQAWLWRRNGAYLDEDLQP